MSNHLIFKKILDFLTIFNLSLFYKNNGLLVFDKEKSDHNGLPKNFRDLSKIGINAIASAQFNENELQQVRKKYLNEKITIVDLRQESHGIINDKAVSWRGFFTYENINKTTKEIILDENLLLKSTKKQKKIIINDNLENELENGLFMQVTPKIIDIKRVLSEKALAEKYHFKYKRFNIRDHHKLNQEQLEAIEFFIKNLAENQKLYIHCAGGKGRTTTFLVLLDIIKNCQKFSLKEIVERQAKNGGCELDKFDNKQEWRTQLAKDRFKMIENLYQKYSSN